MQPNHWGHRHFRWHYVIILIVFSQNNCVVCLFEKKNYKLKQEACCIGVKLWGNRTPHNLSEINVLFWLCLCYQWKTRNIYKHNIMRVYQRAVQTQGCYEDVHLKYTKQKEMTRLGTWQESEFRLLPFYADYKGGLVLLKMKLRKWYESMLRQISTYTNRNAQKGEVTAQKCHHVAKAPFKSYLC